jgi:hypothetical protein
MLEHGGMVPVWLGNGEGAVCNVSHWKGEFAVVRSCAGSNAEASDLWSTFVSKKDWVVVVEQSRTRDVAITYLGTYLGILDTIIVTIIGEAGEHPLYVSFCSLSSDSSPRYYNNSVQDLHSFMLMYVRQR